MDQRRFLGRDSVTILCDPVMVDTRYYTFVKTNRMNSNVNYEL